MLAYDKELRIDNQYYLKNREVIIDEDDPASFLYTVRDTVDKITGKTIEDVRAELKSL